MRPLGVETAAAVIQSIKKLILPERNKKQMNKDEKHQRLVKKAIRGNADAYGQLIQEYQAYLYKMAFLYMRNQEDALDVVGTTVLKGYQNIRSLKNAEHFKTWITRILMNAANDAQKKIVYYSDINEVQISERHKGVSLEEQYDLHEAIEQLPDKYRTVIILKYFSGMSVNEIAFVLDSPEGTVKAYLSRARDLLKKYLKEDYMYADHI
ncbi:sigma-70 family RNA polymerase sigma factor [Faecalicatena sp.]